MRTVGIDEIIEMNDVYSSSMLRASKRASCMNKPHGMCTLASGLGQRSRVLRGSHGTPVELASIVG